MKHLQLEGNLQNELGLTILKKSNQAQRLKVGKHQKQITLFLYFFNQSNPKSYLHDFEVRLFWGQNLLIEEMVKKN